MIRRIFCASLVIMLSFCASIALSAGLELSFFLGMKDGSENSDGTTVMIIVEEDNGNITEVFNEHWVDQQWSDKFIVDLNPWGGQTIKLNLATDAGGARDTGWDWILIGEAMVTADGALVYDIGQAVADGLPELSIIPDGQDVEQPGLSNGASCSPDGSTVGGETKPKAFMQHVPWDGVVGITIARYEISLPAVSTSAVEASRKIATTWGKLKAH